MQFVLDIFIFLAQQMILAFFLFWLMWWLGPGRRRDWTTVPGLSWGRLVPIFASVFVLAAFTAIAAWYVTLEGFAGEVEPVVTSLSWQVQSGQTLYTTFEQAERYSVLYGPSVFLTNGLFLHILGPSLVSAKIASALAAVGSLIFLYAALSPRRFDSVALVVTAGAALFYWAQGFAIYLVRPDALLVFALGLGFYAATRTSRWLAIFAVAVLAGFTINLKIHSLLYFLPVIVVLAQRLGLRAAIWALSGAAVVAVGPFVLYPQISAVNYLKWLSNEARHGFRLDLLVQPIGYTAFLGLPLVVLAWLRGARHEFLGAERPVVLSMLPAVVCALVLSAKPGSGIVHLLPLVPSVMFVVGRLVRPLVADGLDIWDRRLMRSAAAAVVLTVLLAGSVNQYRASRLVNWQVEQIPGIVNDVEQIMDLYDGLPMAMALGGEELWYRCTWYKPLLAFRDNPVLLDPISVMDTVKSGKPLSAATYNALTEGRVALWLVPRSQAPFLKMSWYDPDVPIFPPDFVQHFHDCYTLRGQSRYFDLWFWNGLDPVPSASLASYELRESENPKR
ncbi:MAG: hypothetical protein KAH56_07885 [Candidatus Krumholzibacteria bacterium]|nr:hypothetical protein [Candidatus Krumholzibacteria bacterium]